MIAYWDYEQRSEDWYNIRRGLVTASKASEFTNDLAAMLAKLDANGDTE